MIIPYLHDPISDSSSVRNIRIPEVLPEHEEYGAELLVLNHVDSQDTN